MIIIIIILCTLTATLPQSGVDPFEELLLGPTFACLNVLNQLKLQLSDIGVIEFHEAFAGQVLANMTAMASDKFAKERFPGGKPIGQIDMSKTNLLGGSLALGHPFGATGARLVTTASNRLQRENQRFVLRLFFVCSFDNRPLTA